MYGFHGFNFSNKLICTSFRLNYDIVGIFIYLITKITFKYKDVRLLYYAKFLVLYEIMLY